LDGLVPHGDRSYHTLDLIHPSAKGSTEIGKHVAEIIRKTEAKRR
jgi:lysophospholipase L1-like esterase